MLWLLLGAGLLFAILASMRAFERASAAAIRTLLTWIAAFFGVAIALLMLLTGRGMQALVGLGMVGPLLWRRWQGGAGPGPFQTPPRRAGGAMGRDEAYAVLGLKPGATEADIRAAYMRLMRMAHPDSGGSDWLASRINQARDVLLG